MNLADYDLDRESFEDVPVLLSWGIVDWLSQRAAGDVEMQKFFALKGVSEFAYRAVGQNLTDPETMAKQLEAMAGYLRRNMT